jgi:hypothetical protein
VLRWPTPTWPERPNAGPGSLRRPSAPGTARCTPYRNKVIGALNLFSTSEGRIDANDGKVIQALADVATIGLLQQRAIAHGEILTEQLQVALASRVSIEQAKGALARMRRVSVDEAFTLMRTHARQNHLKLTDLALAVIHDPASQPGLTGLDLG